MSTQAKLAVVVLAAGKGTRMKSDKAKVLHEVCSRPMVHHVLNAVQSLYPSQTITIVGHQREAVAASLREHNTSTVTQEEQLGTGHAVLIAENSVHPECEFVMILCGDTPLIRSETLRSMYENHCSSGSTITLMTTLLENPTNYGRILTDSAGRVAGIVEQKDANPSQLGIKEINAGIYCVDRDFLFRALKQVGTDNSQGEVYLTDIVSIAVNLNLPVERFVTQHAMDVLGVNSRVELAEAHKELNRRRNIEIMLSGVTIHSPETVYISPDARVGIDTLIMPGVHISGNTVIGNGCILKNGVCLTDCVLGDNVTVEPYAVLYQQDIPENSIIAAHTTAYEAC